MKRFFAMLTGLGYGAAFMYFLDPQMGKRRRSLMRDKFVHARTTLDRAIEAGVDDLENKVIGLRSRAGARIMNQPVTDWVLAERARAAIGTLSTYPSAIEVQAQDGALILQGDVLEDDVERLLKRISKATGVRAVENQLRVHPQAEGIEAFRSAPRMRAPSGAWAPSTRLLAGLGTLYLLLKGRRSGVMGFLYSLGGLGLGIRTLANKDLKSALGLQPDQELIHVAKSIEVQAPIEEVYALWSNFEQFPRFMSNVIEIQRKSDGYAHWVVKGPAGAPVEFDTTVTEQVENQLIAWQTTPDSPVVHRGRVRFAQPRDGYTQVNVRMSYSPPAGVLGHAVASLTGSNPRQMMNEDLMNLKRLFEQGEDQAVSSPNEEPIA